WRVYIVGAREPTPLEAVEWARRVQELGAGEILLTSIDMDGTRKGYDVELIHAITSTVNIPVIASGGAGNPQHFLEAFKAGADAALAASIFHYRIYSIREVKDFLAKHGIEVRM
ncbi:MAG TPA: imidazole glycerol phosphate synthase subunit HisF, partial [Pyrodictium sp.]|nr:imidazole glycerol phosphate synthase subunit HisF [Pyrodictium sp.]